ncbi:MAG: hypothetical protein K2N51_03800 [Lachnospiraceae bacterium]|nr:hypothetical protein [Lachnospiraceae bacterium]
MTKQELAKYPALKRRAEKLKEDIYELQTRDIDSVSGKVKGSMREHPYTERRFSVQMEVPEEAEKVRKQIASKRQELEKVKREMQRIEEFIDSIEDVHTKTIFEYRYLEGMTCEEVGKKYGYTRGRVSQIISNYFKTLNKTKQIKHY